MLIVIDTAQNGSRDQHSSVMTVTDSSTERPQGPAQLDVDGL